MVLSIVVVNILMVILTILLVLCVTLIIYARWNYGSLEAMGVPVVKPHWFLGSNYNFMDIYHHWEDVKRSKELGPVYGVYEGRTPVVFVSDSELIYKMIFSESEHFGKREQDFGNPIINENIEFQNGEKWKAIHNLLSPVFTSGKIKMQSEAMVRISSEKVEFLKSKTNSEGKICRVDLHEFFAPFTIQTIAEVLCGIKISEPNDPNNSFIKSMRDSLFDGLQFTYAYYIMQVFPFLLPILGGFGGNPLKFLVDHVTVILDQREQSGYKISDTVGSLLELRKKSLNDPQFKKLGIDINSVYAQAFEFFAASFFGVTITQKQLCYFLVTQPEVYSKLQEEIDTVLKKFGGEISFDSVSEMDYLDACISETLRIAPGFFRPERTCVKDWKSGTGINLKAGTHVAFPMFAVHHNPELFPEPAKFLPDRFLPENKDKIARCSFLSFGLGQRQCLGKRMVYPLLKICMASILKEFTLEKREDTKWVESPGAHLFMILDPIYINFVKRKL